MPWEAGGVPSYGAEETEREGERGREREREGGREGVSWTHRRMELDELHILQGKSGARHHCVPVARARVRRRCREPGPSVAAGGENRLVCPEPVQRPILHAHGCGQSQRRYFAATTNATMWLRVAGGCLRPPPTRALHRLEAIALPSTAAAAATAARPIADGTEIDAGHAHALTDDTAARAVLIHDEVKSKVLDEELRIVFHGGPVKRMEHCVACPVGGRAASVRLPPFAEVETLASKRTLVDLALLGAGEWHAVILQFDDGLGGLAAHILDGVLIAQPVGALDCVVGVPTPVVLRHVAESGVDAALGRNGVGARREELCNTPASHRSRARRSPGAAVARGSGQGALLGARTPASDRGNRIAEHRNRP